MLFDNHVWRGSWAVTVFIPMSMAAIFKLGSWSISETWRSGAERADGEPCWDGLDSKETHPVHLLAVKNAAKK